MTVAARALRRVNRKSGTERRAMRSLLLAARARSSPRPPPPTPATPPSPPSTAPRSSSPSTPPRRAGRRRRSSRATAGAARARPTRTPTSDEATGNVGVGALRKAGFNVLTWDSRGFGNSGGTVTVDSPDAEGARRHRADRLARPAARGAARRPGDPRVGMTGVSYAGGIELVDRRADKRIDAIAPIIAWHSLPTSALQGGDGQGRLGERALPRRHPRRSKGRLDPHITVRVHLRRRHRHAERRGPRLVRQPRAQGPREADHGPHVPRRGHGRHAVHAQRGDHQLRDPQGQRGPGQDAVVLRRPRRLPDRRGPAPATSSSRRRLAEALRRRGHDRRHRPGLRVAGRRRPVALGRRLPRRRRARRSPRRAAGTLVAQPRRRRLRHRRHRRAAPPTRVNVPVTAPAAAQIVGEPQLSLTYSRHRHRHPRLRPDSSTRPAASSSATRPRRSR